MPGLIGSGGYASLMSLSTVQKQSPAGHAIALTQQLQIVVAVSIMVKVTITRSPRCVKREVPSQMALTSRSRCAKLSGDAIRDASSVLLLRMLSVPQWP